MAGCSLPSRALAPLLLLLLLLLHSSPSTGKRLDTDARTPIKARNEAPALRSDPDSSKSNAGINSNSNSDSNSNAGTDVNMNGNMLIPPYTPIVTPSPDQSAILAAYSFRQETYYECRTRDGAEHCGWHIPLVKAEAGGPGLGTVASTGAVVAAVLCLAAVFAVAMM
ncbi:hypothetical protein DCS_05992 [Drechmeria coniospora]|uniref:Uncharacterized protein n=1 Tax=Drechmeria coniospora TaxID=98403 RepID=A0A151GAD0_DRECN|nr:hypothetical protein DCS_05992 [Drechmeria coniospora]KYK54038.1 hypothetical protein DCS_05992 [Drechmeria coniospora]ODA78907.1 hypothetical protein RJ55_04497 [Drechmeria coniospora]